MSTTTYVFMENWQKLPFIIEYPPSSLFVICIWHKQVPSRHILALSWQRINQYNCVNGCFDNIWVSQPFKIISLIFPWANCSLGQKWYSPQKNHLTTYKQKVVCLRCDTLSWLWVEQSQLYPINHFAQQEAASSTVHDSGKLQPGFELLNSDIPRRGSNEPCHKKTCLQGFWPGKTQPACAATEAS